MNDQAPRPRTEQTIVYELLRSVSGGEGMVVGTATFDAGRASVEAPDAISVAVSELLARAFVDRVQADERPRGYRRSRRGQVDMLVPGMPEHFIARLRGLWLPYPDGSVVTARPTAGPLAAAPRPATFELTESGASVTDPAIRRATLGDSGATVNAGPLVRANDPQTGLRPAAQAARTDCGWVV